MNAIQKIHVSALVLAVGYIPAWASPPGEILVIVKSIKEDQSLESHIIEPDWYVAPDNTYTQKTLEHALLKRCLKVFKVKTPQALDRTVSAQKHFCNEREGCGHRSVPAKLAFSSKLFLEAFHEFSKLWHHPKPSQYWTLRTDEISKQYSVCEAENKDTKRFLKPSRHKGYLLSCDILKDASYTRVCLSIFRKKDNERMFSLMGKQYTPKKLEELLKDAYEKDRIKRFKI